MPVLQLLLLLFLACSSSAQGVQPGAEGGSEGAAGLVSATPALAAHVIEVNDSLGLYEALLVAEQEDLTILLLTLHESVSPKAAVSIVERGACLECCCR